jgi:L-alanine-DL-glutamate epimerase-like enolase superfamily enzyme
MGYTHRKVAENGQTTVYERTDEGLFGWGILAAGDKDYVAIDNQTGTAVSGSTVGEACVRLEQLEEKGSAYRGGSNVRVSGSGRGSPSPHSLSTCIGRPPAFAELLKTSN